MRFNYWDLGYRSAGEVVEVTLSGSAANVRLMDSTNYQDFQAGRQARGIGGLVQRSPHRMQIPHAGHWYVTIDMPGLRGNAQAGVRVVQIPRPLPPAPPSLEMPLASVPSLVQPSRRHLRADGDEPDEREYDLFISHAHEDKDEVVRPLAHALQAAGLDVWYDEFELRIGDSLRRKIDRGLARSRFGIVVLSGSFFKKGWTNYELDGLVTKAVGGEQTLLPVWHNITKKAVMEYSPSLADKVGRSTTNYTVEEIAEEIADSSAGTKHCSLNPSESPIPPAGLEGCLVKEPTPE